MKKPKKPKKTFKIGLCDVFTEYYNKRAPFSALLDWIDHHVPEKYLDTVELSIWADSYADFQIDWKEERTDPNYNAKMKRYEKQLAKYNEELKGSK